jgi:hypothetical protein
MFCAPRTRFRQYRGRQLPFSCFAFPDSFSAIPRALGPVFFFCAPELVFGGTVGVGSRFHVLRSRTHFGGAEGVGSCFHVLRSQTLSRRYQGRRVPFSCFALQDTFSAVPRASCPVLRSQTYFWRCGGRMLLFQCFALLDSFSAVP